MSILTTSKVSHTFGQDLILNDISLAVDSRDKIGLVGKNGSGKSTLFKIICKKIEPVEGDVHLSSQANIAFLQQEISLDKEKTVFETVLNSRPDILNLEKELELIQKKISENASQENYKKLADTQHKFEEIQGYAYEAKVRSILKHLNFPEETWHRKIKNFSGGEQTRIQLAQILLKPFDLLLLDEPTNHLDFSMIFWLEKYLNNLDKPYMVISHNRSFLDAVTNKTFEIVNKKISVYKGNYTFYLKESKLRKELLLKQYEQQKKKIAKEEEFIRRNIAGQKTKQAQGRRKQLERMERIEKPLSEKDVKFRISSKHRSGQDVLKSKNLSIGFPEKTIAHSINIYLGYKDRVAIVGKNGCGKSTLLKTINQELKPLKGDLKIGASLKIGYYDQKHIKLDDDLTVLETIWQLMRHEPIGKPLSYLARFGFKEDYIDRKNSTLSGGERSRLYLAKLIFEKPNFLILDEPTNHLDLNTIENLEKALKNYDGTLLFVSHDKYFLENLADKIWYFENNKITTTELSISELFEKEINSKEEQTDQKNKSKKTKPKTGKKKVNPYIINKLWDEIETLQDKNEELKQKLELLYDNTADPQIYSNEQKIKEIQNKIKMIKTNIQTNQDELDLKELKYLELTC